MCPTLFATKSPRYLLLVTVLTSSNDWLLLIWLTNIFLTYEYRLGSVLECSDSLLLIMVGIISDFGRLLCRLESDYPLKSHNRAPPHAYVITVPHFAISVWFYCLLVTLHWQLYATTIAFYVSLKQRDRLLAVQYIWRQSWWNFYVWTIHTNHCLDTLCWSNSMAGKAYKIATMRYLATAKLELTDTVAI